MLCKGILPYGAALLCAVGIQAQAQVAFNGNYTQDFDSMGPSGTELPEGWSAIRSGGSGTLGAALTPGVTTGTATGGGVYNTGAAGDADRALGTLASGSTVPSFGLQLVNNSGVPVDELTLSGVMEQWRTGSSDTIAEDVVFEYSLNASGIGDAGALWTPFAGMDLMERVTSSTSAGAIDGNSPDNQWMMSGLLQDLNWTDQGVLTFRWSDSDAVGSDGLFALDNFSAQASIAPVPEPTSVGTFAIGLAALWVWRRRVEHTPTADRTV